MKKTKEVEEVYFEHYNNYKHFLEVAENDSLKAIRLYSNYQREADSNSAFGAYQEPPLKSKYNIKDVTLLKGDRIVIRGTYLSIKEYDLGMLNFHMIEVDQVKENSFITPTGLEIDSKYYKYFHLVDGIEYCPINEKKLNYRKRFESLA